MDKFIKIPGLQHISEDILKLLDKNILIECRLVNSSWKTVLEQPRFWLKKFKLEKLPLDGQESLKALVKKLEDDQMAKNSANDLLENFNLENKLSGLAQRLRNDELSKEFVLLMIKIYKGKENNLLKVAVRLKGGYTYPIIPNELKISRNSLMDTNTYQELIKFIIEHENLNSKLNLAVSILSVSICKFKKSYSCLLCDTVFIKKESWRIHKIGRHNGKGNFTSFFKIFNFHHMNISRRVFLKIINFRLEM